MRSVSSMFGFLVAITLVAGTAQAATLFAASYDSGKTAEIVGGSGVPTVAGTSTIDNANFKYGGGALNTTAVTSGGGGLKYGTASNFNPLAGTVEMWFRVPGYDGSTRQELFSIFAGGFTGDFSLYLDNTSGGRLKVDVDVAGNNQWQQRGFQGPAVTGDGNFHHVAFEWDTNAGFTTLYLDGVAESFTPLFGTVSFAGGTLGANMEIGSRQAGFDRLNGQIDDLRISNVALYNQVSSFTPPGPVVPEPTTLALLACGPLLFMRRRPSC